MLILSVILFCLNISSSPTVPCGRGGPEPSSCGEHSTGQYKSCYQSDSELRQHLQERCRDELVGQYEGESLRIKKGQGNDRFFRPFNYDGQEMGGELSSHLGQLCENELSKPWREVIKNKNAGTAQGRWRHSLAQLRQEITQGWYFGPRGTVEILEDEEARKREYAQLIYHCEALITVSHHSRFGDSRISKSGGEVKSSYNGALSCAQSPNPQQCMLLKMQGSSSLGAELSCRHKGIETQDFLTCRKMLKLIDGFALTKQITQTVQEVRTLDKQGSEQSKLEQKARSGEGLSNKDVLGSQRTAIKHEAQMAHERVGVDSVQLGLLINLYKKMPTRKKLMNDCLKAEVVSRGGRSMGLSPFEALSDESVCSGVIQQASQALLLNTEAREAIKLVMARVGAEVVENAAKGALLRDQASQIKKFMDEIEEKEKPDLSGQFENYTPPECLVDPNKEGCIVPDRTTKHEFPENRFVLNFPTPHGPGHAHPDNDPFDNLNGEVSPLDHVTPQIIPQLDYGDDNALRDTPPAPGKMESLGFASGAGGGGGGAGGAHLATGGGSNSAARGPGGASGKSQVQGIKLKGSGKGSLNLRGGRGGRVSQSSRKQENPFKKLLSQRGRNPANGVLNFKNIGLARNSIFSMISKRYGAVVQKNRLLKYKHKKQD